jgi:hypothetical protein
MGADFSTYLKSPTHQPCEQLQEWLTLSNTRHGDDNRPRWRSPRQYDYVTLHGVSRSPEARFLPLPRQVPRGTTKYSLIVGQCTKGLVFLE